MIIKCRTIIAVLVFLPLMSCQPQYALDQTEFFARKIGVINQFDISRQNRRIIPSSSRLCVVAEPNDRVDMEAVGDVVASSLEPFFQAAAFAGNSASIQTAARVALKKRADFAVLVQITDTTMYSHADKPDDTTDYHRLQMLLVIVDANSGNVFDKVQLLVRTPHYSVFGRNIKSLLTKPITQIGSELTGAD